MHEAGKGLPPHKEGKDTHTYRSERMRETILTAPRPPTTSPTPWAGKDT